MSKKKEKPKAEPKAESKPAKETKESAPAAKKTSLPQNILQMGEYAEENKRIYIFQETYKEIQRFTKSKTQIESGGILVGDTIEEFGKTNIMIRGFVEAKYSEGTPTTLTFTHRTWEYVHAQIDKCFSGMKIVGWIHTHPSFGIFLSEYDKFIQGNFFNDKNQIAYVVDPIQRTEGFFFWKNEEIERSKGFFIFDDVDVTIDVSQEDETNQHVQQTAPAPHSAAKDWQIWILYALIAVVLLLYAVLFGQFKALKSQHEMLRQSIAFLLSRQNFSYYQVQPGVDTETDPADEGASEPALTVPSSTSAADNASPTDKAAPATSVQTDSSEQTDHE